MKKGLVVVLLVVGLSILGLAAFVVVRGMSSPRGAVASVTPQGQNPTSRDYSAIFDESDGEVNDVDATEFDGGDLTEEGTDGSEESDDGMAEESTTDTGFESTVVDNTEYVKEVSTPTPRPRRTTSRRVTRNATPVGHKDFGGSSHTSSSTGSSSSAMSSSSDSSFDDSFSDSSFSDTSTSDTASSSGGFDDFGSDTSTSGFDSGSSDSGSTDMAFNDTSSGSGSSDMGFDSSGFDDSSSSSSGSDDGFGFSDGFSSDSSSASSDTASSDDSGGGGFDDFFDDAGSTDSGGAAADPFAATGGGGSSQSFSVTGTGPAVKRVSHNRSGGLTEIRIELANANTLPQYRVFPLRARGSRPARVWVDFENTGLGQGPPVAGDGSLIKQIKLMKKTGASASVARVQIELTGSKPPAVDWREESGALVVILGGAKRLGQGREFPRRD